MQTDVSNVLSDLKTLSDNADQIIQDSNFGNDQVGQWFSFIKDTAIAIVKGTYCQTSTGAEKSRFLKDDLPSLITFVKRKQNTHRVSALLAEVQKDKRVRLSHRKSRKSLRKIVLGKKSGNQWKISNRKSSVTENVHENEDASTSATPKVKDRLLESQFRSPLNSSTSKNLHSKSYFSELDSSSKKILQMTISTPCQNKDILDSNADESTPITRSKLKYSIGSTKVVELQKKNIRFSSQNSLLSENKTPSECNTFSNESEKIPSLSIKSNSIASKGSTKSEDGEFSTPENKTIILDSDGSAGNKYETPVTRSKRKSSIQHTQENAKKIKNTMPASQVLVNKHNNSKWDENFTGNNAFKQIKLAKEINPVIPAKNVLQQNQIRPEKRILKEIQKKEEKVNQNAKKLRSMQKIKMEENKKAREKKMEKALQQRMRIEKEKEERIRSRTQSKQENLQQADTASKKAAQKRAEPVAVVKKPSQSQHEDKYEPPRKPLRSPVKKVRIFPVEQNSLKCAKNVVELDKTYDPSPKEIANTKLLNNLNATYVRSPADIENNSTPSNEKAPPKPIRNVKNLSKTPSEKSATSSKPEPSALSSNSTCSVKADNCHSSTPVTKKVESKMNLTKTPVMNKAKKPNSYVMTPHQGSFVSYDISEIKSDDSDDEEESAPPKQIPTWASGVHLRNALLNQHYASIKIDELFGNYFGPPNLSEIMGTEKRHYHKRTSSAIWLDSPNRSRSYFT